jgi:hypothetical protein
MKYKTSKKDLEFFRVEFLKWQARFGLTDWEVFFAHQKAECEAGINIEWTNKSAIVVLATDWEDTPVTKEKLKEDAMHEAIHLVLAPIDKLSRSRFCVTEKQINEADEDTVRRIATAIGSILE